MDKHVAKISVVTETQEEALEVAEAIRLLLQKKRLGCHIKVSPAK